MPVMPVKSVPGCLVTMAPSLIGVPLAFCPLPSPHAAAPCCAWPTPVDRAIISDKPPTSARSVSLNLPKPIPPLELRDRCAVYPAGSGAVLYMQVAIGTYDHTKGLKDGSVSMPGIDFQFVEVSPITRA